MVKFASCAPITIIVVFRVSLCLPDCVEYDRVMGIKILEVIFDEP